MMMMIIIIIVIINVPVFLKTGFAKNHLILVLGNFKK